MILKKQYVTSNASRRIIKLTSTWFWKRSAPRLSFRYLGYNGRSSGGRIICWTKTSLKKKLKNVSILTRWNYRNIGFISTFKLTPRNSKLLGLIILSCGSYFYSSVTDYHKVLKFIYYKPKHDMRIDYLKRPTIFRLYHIRRLAKVSMLELIPGKGIQYAVSSGCFAKIINFNYKQHVALLSLPSGVKKLFSVYSVVLNRPIALKRKRKVANTKSGFWRVLGKKSMVRGVAMNPVDHPHGGRTKSVKYPRTPWGLTTKYK